MFFRKPLAFVWRDFLSETSYKLAFIMQIFRMFVSLFIFFFLSKLMGSSAIPQLKPYGGDYFAFVLIGIAFFSYLNVSSETLTKNIREGQSLGTLEALLVTQTSIPTIILSSTLYSFIWATFRVFVYLVMGSVFFGVNIDNANAAAALTVLILTIISFGSLGIISASFVMVLKKGDPVSFLITNTAGLLGGLYYPISVLPDWLQFFSYLLPVTYALEGMRQAVLMGLSFAELIPNIGILCIFSALMLPISLVVFSKAVKRARQDGSLTQY